MVLVLRRCLQILSVRTALYLISSLLWLVLIHVELRNCPELGTKTFGILPLCSVTYPSSSNPCLVIILFMLSIICLGSPTSLTNLVTSVHPLHVKTQAPPSSLPRSWYSLNCRTVSSCYSLHRSNAFWLELYFSVPFHVQPIRSMVVFKKTWLFTWGNILKFP